MATLMDMYAGQIANARSMNYPAVGQRPINSGIVVNNVNPGYGDVAQGLGAIIGQNFVKPRLDVMKEKYIMDNDPEALDKQLKQGFELWNQMPKYMQDKLYEDPKFQERMKVLGKAPTFSAYATKFEDGTITYNIRNKTLPEAQAEMVKPVAESEIGLRGAQASEANANVGKIGVETNSLIPAQAKAYTAQSVEAQAKAATERALLPGAPGLQRAQTNYMNDRGMAALRGQTAIADRQVLQEKEKSRQQVIGGFQKTLQTIDSDMIGKVGGTTSLPSAIEKSARITDAALITINNLQPINPKDPAITAAGGLAIDHLYGATVRLMAGQGEGTRIFNNTNWIPQISIPGTNRYIGKKANVPVIPELEQKDRDRIIQLHQKMEQVVQASGPSLDVNTYKKFIWTSMQLDPKLQGVRQQYKSYNDIPTNYAVKKMFEYYGLAQGGK